MNLGHFARQKTGPIDQVETPAGAQKLLRDYLQENTASLLGTLRGYVLRMGLAVGAEVQEVALEIFQECVAEALASAERFDLQAPPRAWLLGIAVNIMKRRKVVQAKRFQREELLSNLARRHPNLPDENAVLDYLMPSVTTDPSQIVEADEQAAALLALVSPEDQHILRLAVLEGHQHTSLAQELGTTPGAARVRLHRTLSRLRVAWQEQQEKRQKGDRNV
ncbi:hypothetical protein KSD_58980 [Ktedonobacter sp. SOSP1-85]|uniref:RNA polymerase sigma factor n=1 Tax=Ktedonobacter sp. SOSP1-85 TaxID=2778367 RepID=UPI001914F426|nr:sigma-70 family RNA polymerase sigma factor [Ktedonobacter sp. SOSP1-85]GHO78127.1 hypothetical protein KSD_58980 [Ktedonobacter sp. SOSP1-85]